MLSNNEKERPERFRDAFVKRFLKIKEEQNWELPKYKTHDRISKVWLEAISSSFKKTHADIGLPIIYFPANEGSSHLLISTKGVFFYGKRGYFTWPELDFISGTNPFTDEITVRTERNLDLMLHAASHSSLPAHYAQTVRVQMTGAIWITLMCLLATIYYYNALPFPSFSPMCLILSEFFVICMFSDRKNRAKDIGKEKALRRAKFIFNDKHPNRPNILYIGINQMVNMGFQGGAEAMGECIMLGLLLYRKQVEKYGK